MGFIVSFPDTEPDASPEVLVLANFNLPEAARRNMEKDIFKFDLVNAFRRGRRIYVPIEGEIGISELEKFSQQPLLRHGV